MNWHFYHLVRSDFTTIQPSLVSWEEYFSKTLDFISGLNQVADSTWNLKQQNKIHNFVLFDSSKKYKDKIEEEKKKIAYKSFIKITKNMFDEKR